MLVSIGGTLGRGMKAIDTCSPRGYRDFGATLLCLYIKSALTSREVFAQEQADWKLMIYIQAGSFLLWLTLMPCYKVASGHFTREQSSGNG